MVYNVTKELCKRPDCGKRSWTDGKTDITLTKTHNIKLIDMKNLFKPHSVLCKDTQELFIKISYNYKCYFTWVK